MSIGNLLTYTAAAISIVAAIVASTYAVSNVDNKVTKFDNWLDDDGLKEFSKLSEIPKFTEFDSQADQHIIEIKGMATTAKQDAAAAKTMAQNLKVSSLPIAIACPVDGQLSYFVRSGPAGATREPGVRYSNPINLIIDVGFRTKSMIHVDQNPNHVIDICDEGVLVNGLGDGNLVY